MYSVPNTCSTVGISVVLYFFICFWGTCSSSSRRRRRSAARKPNQTATTTTSRTPILTHTHSRIEQRVNENERVLPPYPYKTWGGVVRVNKMQPSGKDAEHAVTTATRKLNSTRDNRLSTIRIHRDRFVCTSLAVGR